MDNKLEKKISFMFGYVRITGIYLSIFLIFLHILDVVSTFLAVHYYKIAFETNRFVVFVWKEMGLIYGQILISYIFFIVTGVLFFILFYSDETNKIEDRMLITFGFTGIVTAIINFMEAVIGNWIILFDFWL
jgi:hypothetical protein